MTSDSSPALSLSVEPQPQARRWREAFARLSAVSPPCPGIRLQAWPEMHTVALRFLAEHADAAAELGWTTEELFGVHPIVGAVRVDACGALMISGGRSVLGIEQSRIVFAANSYYRAKGRPPSVPVWEFKEKR